MLLHSVRIVGVVSKGPASESKSHEFEYHSCHLVRTYDCRYVQPKILYLKKIHLARYSL